MSSNLLRTVTVGMSSGRLGRDLKKRSMPGAPERDFTSSKTSHAALSEIGVIPQWLHAESGAEHAYLRKLETCSSILPASRVATGVGD